MTDPSPTSLAAVAVVSDDDLRSAASRWWALAVLGVVTTVVGIIVLFNTQATEMVLAILIAIGLLISGIADLATFRRWPRPWVPVVWGLVSIVAGLVAVAWPDITLTVLVVIVAIALIVRGLVAVLATIADRPPIWGFWVVFGLVEIALGVAALAWPDATLVVISVIIGINLIIAGLIELSAAFRLKALAG
jgi:uncharacterized membrane protein HdeD (DUF308 family)